MKVWNSLAVTLHTDVEFGQFRRLLKTFLFAARHRAHRRHFENNEHMIDNQCNSLHWPTCWTTVWTAKPCQPVAGQSSTSAMWRNCRASWSLCQMIRHQCARCRPTCEHVGWHRAHGELVGQHVVHRVSQHAWKHVEWHVVQCKTHLTVHNITVTHWSSNVIISGQPRRAYYKLPEPEPQSAGGALLSWDHLCGTVFLLLYGDQRWLHTFKRQLKSYLFHIWCAGEQNEHSPPPGAVVMFSWFWRRRQNCRLTYLVTYFTQLLDKVKYSWF